MADYEWLLNHGTIADGLWMSAGKGDLRCSIPWIFFLPTDIWSQTTENR